MLVGVDSLRYTARHGIRLATRHDSPQDTTSHGTTSLKPLLVADSAVDEFGYVVNVDGAVYREGEYLLIERGADEEHAAGLLGLPGGKLEAPPGEAAVIEATVRRELSEEVGVTVGRVDVVTSSTFETDTGTQCLNVVCLCAFESGEARPVATDEVAAVHWISATEATDSQDVPAFTTDYLDAVETHRRREW